MRVNIYAEEMTHRVELVEKTTKDGTFVGVRFYLELPVTFDQRHTYTEHGPGTVPRATSVHDAHVSGPFLHREGDDDSAAVTFWGKTSLKIALRKALDLLEKHG